VRDYKARHASTLLTFDAVVDAIGQIEKKRGVAVGDGKEAAQAAAE
jgi:NifU-like protein involved in Fe-S cluster formation